jgi:arylsulfatase A-like enzyme
VRVLYVDCDTLRADHLGCYGYHRDTSPTVDMLAAQGVRYTSCYASDVPCLPSRTALFSGRFGMRTGVVTHAGRSAQVRYPGDGHDTDPARAPLMLVLANSGMRTVSFSTFHQRHLAWHFTSGWNEVHRFSNSIGAEIATDLEGPARRWLEQNGRDDDWVLHLHFWDPHTVYRTPAQFGNPFEDVPAGDFPSQERLDAAQETYGPLGARDLTSVLGHSPWHPEAMRDRGDFKRWIDGYDTGIRFFDDTLSRILGTLDDLGVLDGTAIVVSTDHGENQGELNLYGAHLTADQPTSRLPLVIRWPGCDAGTVRGEQLYHLDLAPTLCEMLGVATPEGWDGISFAPTLRGRQPAQTRPFLVLGQGAWFVQRSVVSDGHLYVRTLHKALDPMPGELLFDLDTDPHEERNLVDAEPRRAAEMSRMLLDWWCDTATDAGRDPLLDVCREGGSLYVRQSRDYYLKLLRDTGRTWAARELESRWVRPVIDPFDLTRY